jgi:hypothetical protein
MEGVALEVVVSMEVVSGEAVSTAEGFAVVEANSARCEADRYSPVAERVCGAAATGVGVTGAVIGAITITDSLMMSSSATSAFRAGGAGAIRTDITVTVTTITHTITMAMEPDTDTDGTDTTVAPVTDTAMAADQGISGVEPNAAIVD